MSKDIAQLYEVSHMLLQRDTSYILYQICPLKGA